MNVLAPFTWFGRVLLWVVFLPIGLWRSIHHGRRKETDRLIQQLSAQQQPQARPAWIRGIASDELPPAP